MAFRKGLKLFLKCRAKEDLQKNKEEDAKNKPLEELFGGLIKKDKRRNRIRKIQRVISETTFNELSEDEKKEREKMLNSVLYQNYLKRKL